MRESQLLSLPVKLIDNYQEYNRFANERKFNNQYYMVRHGQSEANINNLLCNHLSSPSKLTEQGICQAKEVAEKLADLLSARKKICLFSSPLTRAVQTAEHISKRLGVEYQVNTELRERCYGNWENTKITPEKIKAVSAHDIENPLHNFENIESLMEVTKRITTWITDFDSMHAGYSVIIVSHFNVIGMAINAIERVWPGRELLISHAAVYPLRTQSRYHVNYLECEKPNVSVTQLGVFSKSYYRSVDSVDSVDRDMGFSTINAPLAQRRFLQSQL